MRIETKEKTTERETWWRDLLSYQLSSLLKLSSSTTEMKQSSARLSRISRVIFLIHNQTLKTRLNSQDQDEDTKILIQQLNMFGSLRLLLSKEQKLIFISCGKKENNKDLTRTCKEYTIF